MVTPKKAAAAIIMSADPDPEVLMVKRSEKLRFMAGHHAFPGGRIDAGESGEHVIGAENEDLAQSVHAVAREIFEETGLLCTRGTLPDLDDIRSVRRALLAEEVKFDEAMGRFGVKFHAEDFIPAGVWVTPATVPIRFDTQYFIYRHEGERYEEWIDGELAALEWITPAMARRRWRERELLLPSPVAFALQQLEGHGLPLALEPMRETSHVDDRRPGRIEIQNGLNFISLESNSLPPATATNCVIVGDKQLYVIDPGTPHEAEREILRSQLDNMIGLGGNVAAVLLTHSHPDHTAAAQWVAEKYDAPIWAHAVTAERVDFEIAKTLADNQIIRIEGSPEWLLRCLHTPGHDPGHLCFLEETTKTLIAGDMVANGSTIVVSNSHGGDMTEYLNSLERLLNFQYDVLIPAHGMVFHDDPKKVIRYYIRHRMEREGKIREALEEGNETIEDLLASAYADTPEKLWPLAEHSLRAHLKRLDVDIPPSKSAEIKHTL